MYESTKLPQKEEYAVYGTVLLLIITTPLTAINFVEIVVVYRMCNLQKKNFFVKQWLSHMKLLNRYFKRLTSCFGRHNIIQVYEYENEGK